MLHGTIATTKTNSSAGHIGTPGYQSIEQLQAGVITESVDIYALGCVIIELFGEKRIWEGLSAMQILVKVVMEKRVPSTAHRPSYIQHVVRMCLEEREQRATSTQILKNILQLSEMSQ